MSDETLPLPDAPRPVTIPDSIGSIASEVRLIHSEVKDIKAVLGSTEQPGEYPGDPPRSGTGIRGTLERLARAEESRTKTHTTAAAKTGAVTAAVLAVVLKAAELLLLPHNETAPPAPPPAMVQP